MKDLIPESDAFLSRVISVNRDYFALVYKRNASLRSIKTIHDRLTFLQVKDELYVFSHEGTQVTRLAEDFVGTISLDGNEKQPWFFATLNGFTSPCRVARYDFAGPEEQRWKICRTAKLQGLNADDFETRQVCVWHLLLEFSDPGSTFRFGMIAKTAQKFPCSL